MPNFISKFLPNWILHQHFNKTSTPYMKLFLKYILFSLSKFILLYNISVSRYLQQDNLYLHVSSSSCLLIFNRFFFQYWFQLVLPVGMTTELVDFVQVTTATELVSTKARGCSEYSISQHSPFQSSGSYIVSELSLDISEPWMAWYMDNS